MNNNDNLTDYDLKLKAAGINFSVITASKIVSENVKDVIKEFIDLKEEDNKKIFFNI